MLDNTGDNKQSWRTPTMAETGAPIRLVTSTALTEEVYRDDIISINSLFIVIVIVIFIWRSPFIPSRNLDEVFTYNHIWL